MKSADAESAADSPQEPGPGKPAPGEKDSLAKIFREGFLTTGRVLYKVTRSGAKVVGKKIHREQIVNQERVETEEHIHFVGACGHALPNDPYTLPDGRKVCAKTCVTRCEYERCQTEVPARELKDVGSIKVCPKCYRFCRRLETLKKWGKTLLICADKHG